MCTPILERDVKKAVSLSIETPVRCSLLIRSLVLNTFVQGLSWLVGVNLTPTRMGLTDIWADWDIV